MTYRMIVGICFWCFLAVDCTNTCIQTCTFLLDFYFIIYACCKCTVWLVALCCMCSFQLENEIEKKLVPQKKGMVHKLNQCSSPRKIKYMGENQGSGIRDMFIHGQCSDHFQNSPNKPCTCRPRKRQQWGAPKKYNQIYETRCTHKYM